MNFRLPQHARINIPLPKRMNDPISPAVSGFPLSVEVAEEWSSVEEIFPSGVFQSAVFDGMENRSVNTFPNRGVTAPAVTVKATRMMVIFGQLRFIFLPCVTREAEWARYFSVHSR